MKWEQFKNRLQKEVHQQREEVDVDELWNAIEPQVDELNQKRRKKRIFFFWIFFIGVLGVGGSIYSLSTNHSEKNTTSSTNTAIKEQAILNPSEEKKEKKEKLQSDQNQVQNTIDYSKEKNLVPQETKALNNQLKQISEKKEVNTVQQDNSSLKNNLVQSTATTISKAVSSSSTKEKLPIQSTSSNTNQKSTSKIADSKFSISVLDKAAVEDQKEKQNSSLTAFPAIAKVKDFSLLDYQREIEPVDFLANNNILPKRISPFQFSVGVYAGLSYVNRSLEAKNAESEGLLKIRDEYETMLEANHFGISFEVQHRSGFRFSSGIRKTAIAERYKLQDTKVEVESIMGVSSKKVNINGDTVSIMGLIPQTTTTQYNKEIYNTYSLIDIPLLVGYHHTFNQWNVGVEAGLLLNLSLKTKGIIPNASFEDIDLETQQDNYFQSALGIRYQLGLFVSRSIFRRLELRMTSSLQYFPNDISVDAYGISQKYTLLGAQLGLHYKL